MVPIIMCFKYETCVKRRESGDLLIKLLKYVDATSSVLF